MRDNTEKASTWNTKAVIAIGPDTRSCIVSKSVFVYLGFIVPLENFLLIWRRHYYWWRALNVDLCLALMAIEQWGFFSVPHLLWQGASIYNGHLRSVTLSTIAKHLAVELSLPVFMTKFCPHWDSNTQPSCKANALTHCATAAVKFAWVKLIRWLHSVYLYVELCTTRVALILHVNHG